MKGDTTMMVSEDAEEVLEALWIAHEETHERLIKLSALRITPTQATIQELIDAGIVKCPGHDTIELTDTGLPHARDAIRRHRLAERLLTDVLAVKKEMIHDAACQFEHHLHKGIDENVCTLLGHPKICPHGRPIPPGPCCTEELRVAGQAVAALARLVPGTKGHIAYLHAADPKALQMLISMGVVPGARIALLAGFPSYLFQLGEGQFAVDRKIANEIYVRLER